MRNPIGEKTSRALRYTSTHKLIESVNNLDLKRFDQKRHPIFSVLRLSYDSLPTSKHKSIVLDVALFVSRKQENSSATLWRSASG